MAVSDETAGGEKVKPDWRAIRYEYETQSISQRTLARKHGLSISTLMKRAMREKWKQRALLVKASAARLEAEIDERVEQKVRDELAPFIEAKKVEITKRGYQVGAKGLDRIESLWQRRQPNDSKEEADGARAAETFLRMTRTSLGMGDNSGIPGTLSLNILTNQAAIQVVASDSH